MTLDVRGRQNDGEPEPGRKMPAERFVARGRGAELMVEV
jgi:hypothetical protein